MNPAAGGGRSAKLARPALARLRAAGLEVDVVSTTAPGDAVRLAREALAQGYRKFLAVGGDGTGHEILNGIFAAGAPIKRVAMGFLPLGTGNSFLRDYTRDGAKASLQALLENRTRSIDLMRLTHDTGEIYSFNLVSVGFTANVGALTNRYFKPFGHLGYLLGVFVRLAQLRPLVFAVRCDEDQEWDRRPCLFLTFNNSAYTGGTMWIAPSADPSDGLIEFVHWGPDRAIGGAAHAAHHLRWPAHAAPPGFAARGAPRGIQHAGRGGRDGRRRSAAAEMPHAGYRARGGGRLYMNRAWLAVRSAILWAVEPAAFFYRRADPGISGNFSRSAQNRLAATRFVAAHRVFLAARGWKCNARRASILQRTCFFMVNHVNVFDPFVLYSAVPQYARGWELESHFKIPAYGWLMKRFGNVPVPDVRRPSDLKRMWRLTQAAIDGGTSLIIFPEGKRTRDGHVDEFQDGGFRVAQQLGIPIVPVSLVGSFQLHRTGHWMLWPATVTVIIHDTIDTTAIKKN